MLEMRAAPGCFICIVAGCLADAGTALPHLGVILAHLGAMLSLCPYVDAMLAHFGPSLAHLGAISAHSWLILGLPFHPPARLFCEARCTSASDRRTTTKQQGPRNAEWHHAIEQRAAQTQGRQTPTRRKWTQIHSGQRRTH